MTNILYNKLVRSKSKHWYSNVFTIPYYEMRKLDLKHKIYTFLYNMERTGLTTQGELDWSERMMKLNYNEWDKISKEFKIDYLSYIKNPNQ